MKTLLAGLVCWLILSCTSDEGTGIPTVNTPTSATSLTNSFTVNGASWSNGTFRGFVADSASLAADDGAGALVGFSGIGPENVVFSLAIDVQQRRTGVFPISSSNQTTLSLLVGTAQYVAVDGSIDISAFPETIGQVVTGTFSATLTPFPGPGAAISISAGKFSIKRTAVTK